jgi:predicted RNA binding protein YcfA (HicA-like mRNA interferase family)
MFNTVTRTVGGTTVPVHKGRDLAPPLLRQIARDIGLTVEELILDR